MTGARWASCSRDASYAASQYRHLVIPGTVTTLCGSTASHPEVWRGNTTKPQCPQCLRLASDHNIPAPADPGTMAVCPYPHCPLPEGHEGDHFLPKGLPPAPAPAEGPAESPDWHARYEGYAFRQIRKVRNTMAAELDRDRERAQKSAAELDRQAARLASYDDLITTLEHLKGQLK